MALVGVDVTVLVCVRVFVAVEVSVEVCVEVSVDVSVEVCVRVDVSVVVEVVCVEDVRVGNVRVALGVGPSDGAELCGAAGVEMVRETVGRLLPPLHAANTVTRITEPTNSHTVLRCVTFDSTFVRMLSPAAPYRHGEASGE